MSLTYATPDGTLTATGVVVTGAANAHTALSDGSDATWVTFDGVDLLTCTFGAASPAVPGGAQVVSLKLYLRTWATPGVQVNATLAGTGYSALKSPTAPNGGPTDWAASWALGALDVGSAQFTVSLPAGGALFLYKATLMVSYATKPVVDVTAPTGTLTDDNQPTIYWTPSLDGAGGAQFSAEMKVFDDATYGGGGFNAGTSTPTWSGTVVGQATQLAMTQSLVNDTYRTYGRVAQNPNLLGSLFYSDWAYEQFTVNVPTPNAPSLSVTAEPAASPVGRMKIHLDDNGATSTEGIQVQRRVSGGDWTDIRTIVGRVEGSWPQDVYDYECPVGESVDYRARAIHDFGGGKHSYSTWSGTASATLTTTSWSLIDPINPGDSIKVDLRSFEGHSRAARQSVIQPLSRDDAIVVSDTRGPESGEITFRLDDDGDRDAIMAIADLVTPVYLRPKAGDHERARWVILGDEQITRLVDSASFVHRNGTYQWTEVEPPSGNLTAFT